MYPSVNQKWNLEAHLFCYSEKPFCSANTRINLTIEGGGHWEYSVLLSNVLFERRVYFKVAAGNDGRTQSQSK